MPVLIEMRRLGNHHPFSCSVGKNGKTVLEMPSEYLQLQTHKNIYEIFATMFTKTLNSAQNLSFFDSQVESDRELSDLSEAARGLWVMHGILMGVAWGILAPLAIGAAYLRRNLPILQKGALWLKIHLFLCVLVALLTFVGFVVAVVATLKDGEGIFDDDFHHMAGFAILVLVFVQAFAGYFRPSPVPVSPPKQVHTKDSDEEASKDPPVQDESQMSMTEVDEEVAISRKAWYTRKTWEYTHRMLGILLLGLAWCNCHTGIILQADEYPQYDEGSLLKFFWGITASIAGTILLMGCLLRVSAGW